MSDSASIQEQLELAIASLEAQRPVLRDAVEPALAALRSQLEGLTSATRAAEDQRKQITVLFADVKGFSAMSETMDPEDVSAVMNRLWAGVDGVITSYGGHIDKHIGDSVMALFGVPTAREDDAERAIRAALDMQEVVRGFVSTDEKDAIALQIRIGVNTGLAMLGMIGSSAEYTAIGHTVNVASRLESAAPPGGILVSRQTMALVEGLFDAEAVEPISAKGIDQPVKAHLIKRGRPRAFQGATREVAGVKTRMVGRDGELALLTSALADMLDRAPPQPNQATIFGDPGVGKSRLMFEFLKHVETLSRPVWLFRGRAVESSRDTPYTLLRSIVGDRFMISMSDPPEMAQRKLERGLATVLDADDSAAAFVGHLMGLDYTDHPAIAGLLSDPRQIRAKAFSSFVKLLRGGIGERLLVMLLEDIHWADEESLDLVEHLAVECKDLPIMIVCTSRPDLDQWRPNWRRADPARIEIVLDPLGEAATEDLIDEALQRLGEIPPDLRRVIAERSEGNPFFLEELVRMLIDEGVIEPSEPLWTVNTAALTADAIPATLTSVLQARIDSLDRAGRNTLQRASVIGRVFWEEAVDHLARAVLSDGETERMREVEDVLARREFAYSHQTSAFESTREFIFKHAILHAVVYETVVKRLRRTLHAEAANWLIAASGDRSVEFASEIGDHFAQALETSKAVEWMVKAGDQAKKIHASEAAARVYTRALDLVEQTPSAAAPDIVIAALEGLGGVLTTLARYGEAVDTYQRMRDKAIALDDHLAEARAEHGVATAETYRGRFREALAAAVRSRDAARRGEGHLEEAKALWIEAWSSLRLGMLEEAIALADEVMLLSRELDDRAHLATVLNLSGVVAYSTGAYDDAISHFEEAVAIFDDLGNTDEVMPLLNNIGVILEARGRYKDAKTRFQEALDIAETIGDRDGELVYRSNLGGSRVALGELEEGEANLRLVISMATEGMGVLSETNRLLAESLLGQDRIDEALGAAITSLELALESEDPEDITAAWRVLGSISSRNSAPISVGDEPSTYAAEQCFEKSLEVADKIGSDIDRARTLAAWAIHDRDQGRPESSRTRWVTARELFSKLGADEEIARLEEILGAIAATSG